MNELKVALVQQPCAAPREENLRNLAEQIRIAAAQGAQLIVLSELHNGPYFCQRRRPLTSISQKRSPDHRQPISEPWPRNLAWCW